MLEYVSIQDTHHDSFEISHGRHSLSTTRVYSSEAGPERRSGAHKLVKAVFECLLFLPFLLSSLEVGIGRLYYHPQAHRLVEFELQVRSEAREGSKNRRKEKEEKGEIVW